MAMQINIRLDAETVSDLDALACSEGLTRTEFVRQAVLQRLAAARRSAVTEAYRAAYAAQPETGDDLRRAGAAARRLTGEETWERWW